MVTERTLNERDSGTDGRRAVASVGWGSRRVGGAVEGGVTWGWGGLVGSCMFRLQLFV